MSELRRLRESHGLSSRQILSLLLESALAPSRRMRRRGAPRGRPAETCRGASRSAIPIARGAPSLIYGVYGEP